MRDHPNHGSKILGGLWGGFNYMNFKLALKARSNILKSNISTVIIVVVIFPHVYPNQHHLQESFVQRAIEQPIWL